MAKLLSISYSCREKPTVYFPRNSGSCFKATKWSTVALILFSGAGKLSLGRVCQGARYSIFSFPLMPVIAVSQAPTMPSQGLPIKVVSVSPWSLLSTLKTAKKLSAAGKSQSHNSTVFFPLFSIVKSKIKFSP